MAESCRHRGGFKLVRVTIANGDTQIKMRCDDCRNVYGDAVGHELVDMAELDAYETGYRNPNCARCGNPDTELHHYFPQALARKAGENPDEWPSEYLCAGCHGKWHNAVTPGLVTRRWIAPKPERTHR